MSALVSSLYGRAVNPMTEADKDEAARELWRSGADMIALRLSAIRNDMDRQIIVNELTRQHGARPKRRVGG